MPVAGVHGDPPARAVRRRGWFLLLAVTGLPVAACSSTDQSAPVDTSTPVTLVPPALTTTTAAPVTTTAPTVAPTTAAPETTTTSTTLPPTTTTTEPLAVQELILRGDGIGFVRFGAEPEGVIDYVTSILGGTTADTGWVDPQTFGACDGTVARRVAWGELALIFGDLSSFANGRRHFHGYVYGSVGEIGGEPAGLRTAGGVTIGSRVVDLLAEFPDAAVNAEQRDIGSPPNFYVSDNFRGLLTGTGPDDVVTVLFGGYGCGE
jgi:hypothetical protein